MSGDGNRLRSTPTAKPTLRQRLSGRPSDEPPADSSTSLLISGAVAGGVSKFCTAPIDRVKLMYQVRLRSPSLCASPLSAYVQHLFQLLLVRHVRGQVSTERQFTATAAARTVAKIVNTAGVSALWRGNSIAVVRDVPFGAILFSTYALAEEAICGWRQRPPDARTRSAAGCAAGAIATFLTYPLDVLRGVQDRRMLSRPHPHGNTCMAGSVCVHASARVAPHLRSRPPRLPARFGAEWAIQPRYSSYYQGVKEIMRNEGSAAFFAGLRPTLLGIMPYSALSFAAVGFHASPRSPHTPSAPVLARPFSPLMPSPLMPSPPMLHPLCLPRPLLVSLRRSRQPSCSGISSSTRVRTVSSG